MRYASLVSGFLAGAAFLAAPLTFAQSADELRDQINSYQDEIQKLDADIASFEKQLTEIGAKKQTLQSALDALTVSRKQISARVAATKKQIGAIELEIRVLDGKIGDAQSAIHSGSSALGETIRVMDEIESASFIETLLSEPSLSAVWDKTESLARVQSSLEGRIESVKSAKQTFSESRDASATKRAELVQTRQNLAAQEQSLLIAEREQKALVAQTKSQESNYQKLLAEKRDAKAAFEASLQELESKLDFTLNPSSIPPAGKGVLRWPLDNVFITQNFGKTSSSGRLYASGTHNGVDFRASIGTPIRASLSGTVLGTGNTDGGGCYSYGKWILLKHGNGLSTLYAHLSQISVREGESVTTGEVIGFSGFTGYATGPHLHFSVFASNGVQIKNLGSWYKENGQKATTACAKKGAIIPVAAPSAYLDPLEYL